MTTIPAVYRAIFLYIEPISTVAGAYFAWFQPHHYLTLTHATSAPSTLAIPVGTEVVLRQLGNLYFAFTLNEALVLRATSDIRVWKTLLFGLLVGDVGHCVSCLPLGESYLYDYQNWNSIGWGNIAFVYFLAVVRICFLLGLGLGTEQKGKTKSRRTIGSARTSVQRPSSSKSSSAAAAPTPRKRVTRSSS